MQIARLWGPVIAVIVVIFSVSALSDAPLPSDVNDKTGHFAAYAALGIALVRALAGGLPRRVTARVALAAMTIAVGYGITDETHQMFVPGRSPDIADVYADAAGAMAAVVACWAWGIISTRPAAGARPRDDL